jgi:putative inorganic carbon (HCO3(-)) transporter
MNMFRKVVPVLYPVFQTPPEFDVSHAHNHLLQTALDLGIPGLIAYASIWMLLGVLLVEVQRRAAEPAFRVAARGLSGGLVAFFVFNLTDAIPLGAKVGLFFWLTVAMVVALYRVAVGAESPPPLTVAADVTGVLSSEF